MGGGGGGADLTGLNTRKLILDNKMKVFCTVVDRKTAFSFCFVTNYSPYVFVVMIPHDLQRYIP